MPRRRAPRRRRRPALGNLPTSMTAHSTSTFPAGVAGLAGLGLVPPVVTSAIGFKDPLLGIPYWAYGAGLITGVAFAHFEKGRVEAFTNYVAAQADAAAGAVTKAKDMIVEAGKDAASNAVAEVKSAAFKASLFAARRLDGKLGNVVAYSDLILRVAAEENVSPLTIVALGARESRWGDALDSQASGDRVLRKGDWLDEKKYPRAMVAVVNYVPKDWSAPKQGGAVIGPPYALPIDTLGWGRGIMQIDWPRVFKTKHNWRDPYTNIKEGVKVYKEKLREITAPAAGGFDLAKNTSLARSWGVAAAFYPSRQIPANLIIPATIAAYNAGSFAIRRAYSVLGPAGIDKATTGGDYGSWVTRLIAQLEEAISTSGAKRVA